jgi:KDO2-lipid IV(A) lauroyltransferase
MPSLSSDEVRARVEVNGIEHLKTGFGQGRGVLVVSAHYGYWEMMLRALVLRMPGFELTAVERPQPNPHLRELIGHRRNLDGMGLLNQNALSIRRALRRNAAVGVLADHYLSERKGGLLAPFLGLPAWSNPGPAELALSARCPVLVAHIRRIDESRHCVELAPLKLPALDDRASTVLELTTRINAALGDIIRREPELWLWSNHRWRGSSAVSAELYPSRRRRRRVARG